MLIVPYRSASAGHIHWYDRTPHPSACPWLVVQSHGAQTSSTAGQWFSSFVREKLKGDLYGKYGFRVMCRNKPYLVLAVAMTLEEILEEYHKLLPVVSHFHEQPDDRTIFKLMDQLLPPSTAALPAVVPVASETAQGGDSPGAPGSSGTAGGLPAGPSEPGPSTPHGAPTLCCSICFDRAPDVIFSPCMHFGCCHECAAPLRQCPFCKEPIAAANRVFNMSEISS
jgi:hypothetical protein